MPEPIQPAYVKQMNDLARMLDAMFNPGLKGHDRKVAFVVLIAEFGDSKRCNYISNGQRADIIAMMKETIARFEGQQLKPGSA
jgi:hypothetical protein